LELLLQLALKARGDVGSAALAPGAKTCDNPSAISLSVRATPATLAPVYDTFTEGFTTPDLVDAAALLKDEG